MSSDYFGSHLSLSEWASRAKVSSRDALIREDAEKRARLKFLAAHIALPVVDTWRFPVCDVAERSPQFIAFATMAGGKPFALRANPRKPALPVLRNRNLTVPQLRDWLLTTEVNNEDYELSFEPHIDPERAAIIVVSDDRIAGEAVSGGILQLNKGVHVSGIVTRFECDFEQWRFVPSGSGLEEFVQRAVSRLYVGASDVREVVAVEMGLGFARQWLKGYFEVIESIDSGVIFIDYNRELAATTKGLQLTAAVDAREGHIVGVGGSKGIGRGRARVVNDDEVDTAQLRDGEVLVCRCTSPEFLPLMVAATAVVTDVGGVLSHAAIVCREMAKPCVVGAHVATKRIRDGDLLEVDGATGIVTVVAAASTSHG